MDYLYGTYLYGTRVDLYEVNSTETPASAYRVTATTAVCMPGDDSRLLASTFTMAPLTAP